MRNYFFNQFKRLGKILIMVLAIRIIYSHLRDKNVFDESFIVFMVSFIITNIIMIIIDYNKKND